MRQLGVVNPDTQSVVLTADTEPRHQASAIEAGAVGVISKAAHPTEIVEVIRRVRAGELAQPDEDIVALFRRANAARERAMEVQLTLSGSRHVSAKFLLLLAEGFDNRTIAERLDDQFWTARAYVVRLLAKMACRIPPPGRPLRHPARDRRARMTRAFPCHAGAVLVAVGPASKLPRRRCHATTTTRTSVSSRPFWHSPEHAARGGIESFHLRELLSIQRSPQNNST